MPGISNKQLDAIDEEDLKSLVNERVLECRVMDYKKTLPHFDVPKDKKEFLADVSSFANASGGDLIFGIEENRGIPVNLCGLDIPDTDIDRVKQQIEGIIRLNIGPRIPGISIQPIKLTNEHHVIIIRIPKSWASPHMVTLELRDHERFFSRTSSGKYPLDVSELRAAFMLSETMAERIKKFRMDRISNIISGENPVPMDDTPKIILHIIPFTAFDPTKILPTSSLNTVERNIFPMFFSLSGFRFNLDGFLKYGHNGYLQLFRNGIIEVVGVAASKGDDPSDNLIPALDFEKQLHDMLPKYILAQRDMGLNPPFLIALSLVGARNCAIYVPRRYHPSADQKIDRDILLLPEGLIEDFEFDIDVVLKQILDALWNASGFDGSPHFDPSTKKWKEI